MPWKMQKPECLKVAEITVIGIPKTKKSKVECKTAQYKNCSFKSDEWYTSKNELTACYSTSYTVKGFNPGVFLKVGLGWVWSSGRTQSWIGLLLLTVTGVSTTCAVVIFRVKVSCITSFDGIILRLLIWLVNYVAMLSVASFWTKANHTMVIPRTSDEWHIHTQLQIAP